MFSVIVLEEAGSEMNSWYNPSRCPCPEVKWNNSVSSVAAQYLTLDRCSLNTTNKWIIVTEFNVYNYVLILTVSENQHHQVNVRCEHNWPMNYLMAKDKDKTKMDTGSATLNLHNIHSLLSMLQFCHQ